MRISVCEFLRLQTRIDWYYLNPGHWRSGDGIYEARREAEGEFRLFKHGRRARLLTYYEGEPSHVVRRAARYKKNRRYDKIRLT